MLLADLGLTLHRKPRYLARGTALMSYGFNQPPAIFAGVTAWGLLLEALYPERETLIQKQVD